MIFGHRGSGKTTIYMKTLQKLNCLETSEKPTKIKLYVGQKKYGKNKGTNIYKDFYYQIVNNIIIVDKPNCPEFRRGGDDYGFYLTKIPYLIEYLEKNVLDKEQNYVLILASIHALYIKHDINRTKMILIDMDEQMRQDNIIQRNDQNNINDGICHGTDKKYKGPMNYLLNGIGKSTIKYEYKIYKHENWDDIEYISDQLICDIQQIINFNKF